MVKTDLDKRLRVDYIDKHFAKLFNIEGGYYDIVKVEALKEDVKLGDVVTYEFDENQDKVFYIYEKAGKRQYTLEDLYLITDIDNFHIYLLKNGESKPVVIPKLQSEFATLDLVYLENTDEGKVLIKDQKYCQYFAKALIKMGENLKAKGKFSIKRVVLDDFYKHAVSVCYLDDLERYFVEPDSKFEKNMAKGDLYFEINIGKNQVYQLDEQNADDLNNYYASCLSNKFPVEDRSNRDEVLARTKKLLKYFYDKKSAMEKVSKKAETEKFADYQENDVLGEFYLDELEEDNIGKYFRAINHDEDAINSEIKVYLKDLPSVLSREGDSIVMIKDDAGNPKFYFTNKYTALSLQDKIEAEERRLAFLNKGGVWRD